MILCALCYRDRGLGVQKKRFRGVGTQPWSRGLPVAIARLWLFTTGLGYDMFTQMLNASIFVIAKCY